jgi:hypothetical protein
LPGGGLHDAVASAVASASGGVNDSVITRLQVSVTTEKSGRIEVCAKTAELKRLFMFTMFKKSVPNFEKLIADMKQLVDEGLGTKSKLVDMKRKFLEDSQS